MELVLGTLRAVGERWRLSMLVRLFCEAPGWASPVTLADRSRLVEDIAADHLGTTRLARLSPVVVSDAVEWWRLAGVSDGVARSRVNLVRLAVGWAVGEGLLVRDVLVGARGLPTGKARTQTPIPVLRKVITIVRCDVVRAHEGLARDPASRRAKWALFRAQQNKLLVYLVADSGLRRGELAGLRSDDLVGRGLWVERAVKVTRCGVMLGPSKTYRQARMTVSTATARAWREYVHDWFGASFVSGRDTAWLFGAHPASARPVHPMTLADRFGRLVARVDSGSGVRGLHGVRHTVATTLVGHGDVESAQRRLRHSRLDTTLRHYVDTTGVDDDSEIADRLEALYHRYR
jgi:integrase